MSLPLSSLLFMLPSFLLLLPPQFSASPSSPSSPVCLQTLYCAAAPPSQTELGFPPGCFVGLFPKVNHEVFVPPWSDGCVDFLFCLPLLHFPIWPPLPLMTRCLSSWAHSVVGVRVDWPESASWTASPFTFSSLPLHLCSFVPILLCAAFRVSSLENI